MPENSIIAAETIKALSHVVIDILLLSARAQFRYECWGSNARDVLAGAARKARQTGAGLVRGTADVNFLTVKPV
jgi:hypothetical protein